MPSHQPTTIVSTTITTNSVVPRQAKLEVRVQIKVLPDVMFIGLWIFLGTSSWANSLWQILGGQGQGQGYGWTG